MTFLTGDSTTAGRDYPQATFPELPDAMRRSRVLVIDDNPANVLLLERVLRTAGLVNVEGCTDSAEALDRCLRAAPDLLLLDLHMPHPDGFEVMETLRTALPPDVFLPVLVLTADAGSEVKRRALAAGAKDFLIKPLDNVEVVLRVRNLLETEQLVRHLGDAVASQGRAVSRERALRNAAAALGSAGVDRVAIRRAALDAAWSLTAQHGDVGVRVASDLDPPAPGERSFGALVISGGHSLGAEVLDAIETLGSQVGLALESANLAEHLRRREHEEAAAALVQHSSDVIVVVDAERVVRFQTPSAGTLLGYGPGDLVGTRLTDLVRPDQADRAHAHYAGVAATPGAGPPMEWDVRRADGSYAPVEAVSNNLLHDRRVGGIVVTLRDIAQQKAFEDGLRRQVQELRELHRMKSDLVSTVSHELRTPLTSILGHTEMLADGDSGPLTAEQAHVVGIIDRNGHRLLALIEDLLTLARVESQGLDVDPRPVDVAALVSSMAESIRPLVAAREQTLTVDVDGNSGNLIADGPLIERALTNLLSNAVKFTPEGGTVRLAVRRDDQGVVFTVSDSGIGISSEDQKRLFTRFFRSSVATVNAIPGTGLGLSIVKQIVDAHGGEIAVDSGPERGTSVCFTIPTGRRPLASVPTY
jgi:PAS domain S-box-containing protein